MQISYQLMVYISMFIGTRQRMIPSPSADRPLHHRTIAVIIMLLHAPPPPTLIHLASNFALHKHRFDPSLFPVCRAQQATTRILLRWSLRRVQSLRMGHLSDRPSGDSLVRPPPLPSPSLSPMISFHCHRHCVAHPQAHPPLEPRQLTKDNTSQRGRHLQL